MAVNDLERDFLTLLHACDQIENIIAGLKNVGGTAEEKKVNVGNIVMYLETELLDDRYTEAGKDMTRISDVIAAGRTYWKS
jgi:hypothetical protein